MEKSSPAHSPPDKGTEPAPRKTVKRLLKWGVLLVAGVVALLVCAVLTLPYYLPVKTLQPVIEKELSRVLKQSVTIGGLDVSVFHGIEARDIRVASLLKVHSLTLDYDLTYLLKGQVVIDRVIIDKPEVSLVSSQGVWNFQSPRELGKKTPILPPVKKVIPTDETHFPLPLEVDLKHFSINNVILSIAIDDQVSGRLEGLGVQAHGKVSSDALDLTATIALAPLKPAESNLAFSSRSGQGLEISTALTGEIKVAARDIGHIDLTGKLQTDNSRIGSVVQIPGMSGEWDMGLSLKPERIQVRRISWHLGKDNQIKLAGEIRDFLTRPDFKFTLQEAEFHIKEILDLAGDRMKPIRADGVLRVADLEIAGQLPGFRPETIDIHRGKITLDKFSAGYPPALASVEGVHVDLDLQKVRLANLIPQQLTAQATVIMNKGRLGDVSVNAYKQTVQIADADPTLTKLAFSASAGNVEFRHPKLGKMGTGLRMEGKAEGNLSAGDLDLLMTLGAGELKASVQGQARDFGKKSFKMDHSLNVNFESLLKSLPPDVRKQTGLDLIQGVAGIETHIQGALDADFRPALVVGKADVSLKDVALQLKDPSLSVKGFNLKTTIPVEYSMDKGVKIPPFDLTTRFQKIQASDHWEMGPAESWGRTTLPKSFLDVVPLKHHAKLTVGSVGSVKADAKISGLVLEADVQGNFSPAQKNVRNIKLRGDVSFKNAEGLQKFKAGKSHVVFTVDAQDSSLAHTKATLKASLLSPTVKQNNSDFKLGEVKLDSLVRMNLKGGDVDIDSLKLEVPATLKLDVKGLARKWGEQFAAEGRLLQLRLLALPVNLAGGIKVNIAGTGDFSVKGSKPADLKGMKFPVEAHAGLSLSKVSFADERGQLKAEGIGYSTQVDLKNNDLKAHGKLTVGKLFKRDLLGDAWLEPEFEYQYALTDWNKLVIEKHALAIKNRGITHALAGRVEGLKRFVATDSPFLFAEISKRLDIALTSMTRLKIDRATPITKNFKADGDIVSRLTVNLIPGKEIVLDGELGFDRFNSAIEPSLKIKGVSGKFPFNKKFALDRKSVVDTRAELPVSQKGFFSQLRDFSAYKNILRVDSVEYDAYKLSRIGMDLLYRDNRLAAEKFIMDLLKGSLGGQWFLSQTAQGPVLNFSTEFAGLDFNDLIGEKTAVGGAKSQIDGNMQLGFKVAQGTGDEKVAIDQIEAKIAITRIGEEALDRVLLFLDPEESKPAIVDTRAKLKLASPQKLLISLENGNLSVEVWLKSDMLGGVVKAPELKRVPIVSLKRFQLISEQLQRLAGFRGLLQYLAARGIEFDEEGGISLF